MYPSTDVAPASTRYSPTTPRQDGSTRGERRWTCDDDGGEVETPQRESVVLQKTKANDERRGAIQERRCGDCHPGELRNVDAQSRNKNVGFIVKTADSEIIVLTRGDMRRLPPGSFDAELVRRCAIADPSLKKQLRGSDVWKGA